MTFLSRLKWLVASTWLAAAAHAAPASALTYQFTGQVTDDPFGIVAPGAAITGSFSFDAAADDALAAPDLGLYQSRGPEFGFSVLVGGRSYSVGGDLTISVIDSRPDMLLVNADNGFLNLQLVFEDQSGLAFSGDRLPLPLALSNYGFSQFRLFGPGAEFLGSVTTVSAVPEPASMLLLAAGVLALLARRRSDKAVTVATAAAAALVLAQPALAVDGVVLIDQNKAFAGNVTPGDAPGFPITISRPGSYRLSGNLTLPNADTSGIEIASDNVTLDLNGFAILGPVVCMPRQYCTMGDGIGVLTYPLKTLLRRFNIVLRNGTVQGVGGVGVLVEGDSHLIDNVTARSNGSGGFFVSASVAGGPSTIRHSVADRNGGVGMYLDAGLAVFNTISNNNSTGLSMNNGTASQNRIHHNQGVGLEILTRGSYNGNSLDGNVGGNVGGNVRPGINLGGNLCNGAVCAN